MFRSGLGRARQHTQGWVIYSITDAISDVPLGFGMTAKATGKCRKADPSAIVVFHQSEVGEYLRSEEDL